MSSRFTWEEVEEKGVKVPRSPPLSFTINVSSDEVQVLQSAIKMLTDDLKEERVLCTTLMHELKRQAEKNDSMRKLLVSTIKASNERMHLRWTDHKTAAHLKRSVSVPTVLWLPNPAQCCGVCDACGCGVKSEYHRSHCLTKLV